ncbi:uncharacterized protein LOC128559311 [Mercenaria mercenaria]|uniref:uncharacterized protein LOC128559311 n=1 Tax=Mercenaria mercenaria TaxID=6596 RepID=UPI00234FB415|nr:uncharacterized protein LOC128559311 [Mercenaria mercenaria]
MENIICMYIDKGHIICMGDYNAELESEHGIFSLIDSRSGNKKKTDPNNYRAITLCSILLKLYENVVLLLLNSDDKLHLNPSQGGFQRNVSCVMTSLMLRENIGFAAENHSTLYACFLDAKQAFDRFWIDLLMLTIV